MSSTKRLILSTLLALAGWGTAIALSRFLYVAWFANIYFLIVLLCAAIVLGRLRPHLTDAILVVASAGVLVLLQFAVFHLRVRWVQSLSAIGFSSLMILGFRAIWGNERERRALRMGFLGTGLLISLYLISMPALTLIEQLHPKVLDLYLYSFDASLHLQASFLLGAAFSRWPVLRWVGQAFYIGLPVSLAVVFAGQIVSNRKRAGEAIAAFFVGGPAGILAYNLFPALGPRYVFGVDFPFHPLTTGQAARLLVEPIPVHGFMNAMPSMHMVWVLLAWWYSRGLSWFYRGVAMTFVVFTALATLGSGEHYLIDLIVAFPFALLLEGACAFSLPLKDEHRARAVSLGLGATALWIVLLRFETHLFWASAVVGWGLAIATVASVLRVHEGISTALDAACAQRNWEGPLPLEAEGDLLTEGASAESVAALDAAK